MAAETAQVPGSSSAARPGVIDVVVSQAGYASRSFLRNPVAAMVTLAFPLIFLVVTGLTADDGPHPVTGLAAISHLAAGAAVFATAMAAFVMLAFSVALAREQGIVKRLRGTPLPMWGYLAGRIVTAVWSALLGTAVMLVVAVVAYELELVTRNLAALAVTLLIGIASLTALGFCVAALVRGSQAVMSVTIGALMLVGFVSELFFVGAQMPRWLEALGWALPLRHFVHGLTTALDPGASAAGFAVGHLAALAGWGIIGGLVAVWGFGRDPSRSGVGATAGRWSGRAVRTASATPAGLVWGQLRHANRSVWRQPTSAFFALAFPTLFVVLLPLVTGNPEVGGVPFAQHLTVSMPVFGVALTAYVTMPEAVAAARDTRVLKRLRGTPLPSWAYLTGRLVSVFWVGAITVAIVLLAGRLVHGVTPIGGAWLPLILALVVGTTCLAALGLAVASLVGKAETVPAVSLATFLPLVFISDVFPVGDALPEPVVVLAGLFPLAHLVVAVREAFTAAVFAWSALGVVALWTVAGAVVALVRFRWEPRGS